MSIGKVTTWFMTPEELAAYVKKNPIVRTKKPTGANFDTDRIDYKVTNERKKAVFKGKKIIDGIDTDQLHKLFMSGISLDSIAKELKINYNTLNNYIREFRKSDPEKWPYRAKGR